MFLQLARVASCPLYIAVQNVQDTPAYTIHEFSVTIRDNSFTQSMFSRLEHVDSVIIHFTRFKAYIRLDGEGIYICREYVVSKTQAVFRIFCQIQEEVAVGFLGSVNVSVIRPILSSGYT